MPLSSFYRFLLPAQNPLGFGASDFILLGLAVLLVVILLARRRIWPVVQMLSSRTVLCMALLLALPIVLRLALLAHHPVPTPRVADDFSYLLLGDTLAHFRLANPMHPMHRFFEGVFILQDPSYSSIYPVGQGLVLAFGELIFRLPWAGVALSVGLLCALCYWMLKAWVDPAWALLGGLFAVVEFGPLSSWMNTYWGGAVSGIAGCLVFGALPRLRGWYAPLPHGHGSEPRASASGTAILLGIGLGLQLLTRPFEFVLLLVVVILFFVPVRSLIIAALVLLPAFGLTLLQNKEVTRSWTTLPYQLSRYQYGIPATFTFQPNPIPHRPLTVEQQIDYDAQIDVHGLGTYPARLAGRVRFYRFFFLAPLYLVLPAFLLTVRQYRFAWVLIALGIFWLGDAFYPYFYPHYIAAETCLFLLVTVVSLERLSRLSREAVVFLLILCAAHFVLWYGVHLSGNQNLLLALGSEESWDSIDFYSAAYTDTAGRIAINRRLAEAEGKQLVFVRYYPQRTAREWIQNAADIDSARVVWAIDLGPDEDKTLRQYYPQRTAWLLEPDARPPRLTCMDSQKFPACINH
jgi:hypothetical protein